MLGMVNLSRWGFPALTAHMGTSVYSLVDLAHERPRRDSPLRTPRCGFRRQMQTSYRWFGQAHQLATQRAPAVDPSAGAARTPKTRISAFGPARLKTIRVERRAVGLSEQQQH